MNLFVDVSDIRHGMLLISCGSWMLKICLFVVVFIGSFVDVLDFSQQFSLLL